MAIFYATFSSLSIHFAGCYDLARSLNMTIQDFQNIHSYHKITTEELEIRLF